MYTGTCMKWKWLELFCSFSLLRDIMVVLVKKMPACSVVWFPWYINSVVCFGWEKICTIDGWSLQTKKKHTHTPTMSLLLPLHWNLNIKVFFFLTLRALAVKLELWWIVFLNNFVNIIVIMVIALEIYVVIIISINCYS